MMPPDLKTVRQWLPTVGGAFFILWIGVLVVLSLLQSGGKVEPSPRGSSTRPSLDAPGCVTLPDGISICDRIPSPGEGGGS